MADKFLATGGSVAAGGTGYSVGNILTIVGGTSNIAALFQVTGVSAGAVTTIQLVTSGAYSVKPSSPAATTGGAGTGCTITLVWQGLRIDSEQADVLDSVLAQLLLDIPNLSSKNCLISIDPDPPYKVPENFFLTISPANGTFPPELVDGGGENQCMEESGVVVTSFSRFMANRPGQEREALSDFTRGILRMKRLILKSLTNADLTFNGNFITRDPPTPKFSSFPTWVDADKTLLKLSLEFRISWDWALTR